MRDALDDQIEAYWRLLPELQRRQRPVWALIAQERLISTFEDFAAAARFAVEHHGGEQVLIRHTGERRETAPYVLIER